MTMGCLRLPRYESQLGEPFADALHDRALGINCTSRGGEVDMPTKDDAFLSQAVAAVFVLFYSLDRFNVPTTNRSSTTAFRYFTGASLYSSILLFLYYLLTRFQGLVPLVFEQSTAPPYLKSLSSPFVAALTVTVLLPTAPFLSALDAKIRTNVYRLVSIPTEALRLSTRLRSRPFSPDESLQEQTRRRLLNDGWSTEDVRFYADSSIQFAWTKVTLLMVRVEQLAEDARFSGFLLNNDDYKRLKTRHSELVPRLRDGLGLLLRSPSDGGSADTGLRAARALETSYRAQIDDLLGAVLDLISRASLQCVLTQSARDDMLAGFGFSVEVEPPLPIDQAVQLFLMLMLVVLGGHLLSFDRTVDTVSQVLVDSAGISVAGTAAIMCAVLSRRRWSFARRRADGTRPYAFYLTAGFLGVIPAALLIYLSLAVRSWSWAVASGDFRIYRIWLLLAFMLPFVSAFLTDDVLPREWTASRLRTAEAVAAAAVTSIVAFVARWDLIARGQEHVAPPLSLTLLCGGVGGALIGFCVPEWFRNGPTLAPPQKVVVAMAPSGANAPVRSD